MYNAEVQIKNEKPTSLSSTKYEGKMLIYFDRRKNVKRLIIYNSSY